MTGPSPQPSPGASSEPAPEWARARADDDRPRSPRPPADDALADRWPTLADITAEARRNLAPALWEAACGGAMTEATLRRNRSALDRIALMPRVLTGARCCDLTTTFLTQHLDLPVMLAPVGEISLFEPSGAPGCARAAGETGTAAFISAVVASSLEDVRAATTAPLVLQVYVFGGREDTRRLLRRAETAGYQAICLTVDTPVGARLDRDLRNRLAPPPRRRPNIDGGYGTAYGGAELTWADLGWLRDQTELPFILKGILHPADAELAVAYGVDAICVSNHGGRQLDGAPAAIDALPDVVDAVDDRIELIVDGGFLRGPDVVKAIALGARAVLIGKLMVLALAAGGPPALRRALDILAAEITNTLLNLGVASVTDLTRDHVRWANQRGPLRGGADRDEARTDSGHRAGSPW